MHLYVIARGILKRIREWEQELSSKYLPYMIAAGRRNNENTKWMLAPQYGICQLSVRPIQFYEIVFPRECLNDVVGMIQPYGGYGISENKLKVFRAILNLSGAKLLPIPKVKPEEGVISNSGKFTPPRNYLNKAFVDVMGIGIKEDKDIETKPAEDL